jgi:hypothetical protein
MTTALDRALESNIVDWSSIKRIVRRQKSVKGAYASLERLVKVPRVPLDMIRLTLTRLGDGLGDYEITPEKVGRCVFAIWYNVLVDRQSGAPSRHSTFTSSFEATEEYTSELLAITDGISLQSNDVINDAFEMTKLVVPALCQRIRRYSNNSLSFCSLVVALRLHPFLLWLAVAEDPFCLLILYDIHGVLPLHEALRTIELAVRPCAARIRFPKEHLVADRIEHSENVKLLDLFNKRTAVQLLCHLSPQACCMEVLTSSSSSSLGLPLEILLCSIPPEHPITFPDDGDDFELSCQELLEDIHAVICSAPMALETLSREFQLYPFCLPQMQMPCSTYSDSRKKECFALTLAYDLLRENPTVVTRHLNRDCSLELTTYEKVLQKRLQSERNKCQTLLEENESLMERQESLKRDIAALREEVAMLKQEDSSQHPSSNKRHCCP